MYDPLLAFHVAETTTLYDKLYDHKLALFFFLFSFFLVYFNCWNPFATINTPSTVLLPNNSDLFWATQYRHGKIIYLFTYPFHPPSSLASHTLLSLHYTTFNYCALSPIDLQPCFFLPLSDPLYPYHLHVPPRIRPNPTYPLSIRYHLFLLPFMTQCSTINVIHDSIECHVG